MRYLSLAFALAACGGGPAKQVEEAKPAASKCPQVGDHLVGLMKTGKAADAPMEVTDKVRNLLVERCTQDAWGMDAQQCFLGLAAIEESDRCAGFLTVEQRDAADKAMADAFPEPAEPETEPSDTVLPADGAGAGAPDQEPGEAAAEQAPEKPKRRTRGAIPKKPEGQGRTGDPCDGGE